MTYFYKAARGVRADIARHRRKEMDLRESIAQLETFEARTEIDDSVLRAYQHLWNQLLDSKVEVVHKIGRK